MSTLTHEETISFEYRFSSNPEEHENALKSRRGLMAAFANELQQKAPSNTVYDSLQLYPVERAGKSGSEVFYLDVFSSSIQYPRRFIAKFQNIKNTEREYDAAHNAMWAQWVPPVSKYIDSNTEFGVLICDLAKIGNHCEFRKFFLSDKSNEDCAEALASIFRDMGIKLNNATPKKSFLVDFNRYVSRSNKPLERLESLYKSGDSRLGIDILAGEILAAHKKISEMFVFDVAPCLIHGDLHARNLMVNFNEPAKTELIDFGWVDYGHPAKDYVLMEVTLKLMLMNEFLALRTKITKESLHLPPSVYEAFEVYLCKHGMTLPDINDFSSFFDEFNYLHHEQIHVVTRVYTCIKTIRRAANASLKQYCNDHYEGLFKSVDIHYFSSMFLVTLGLSSMVEMEPIWTLIGLTKMGARIWESE